MLRIYKHLPTLAMTVETGKLALRQFVRILDARRGISGQQNLGQQLRIHSLDTLVVDLHCLESPVHVFHSLCRALEIDDVSNKHFVVHHFSALAPKQAFTYFRNTVKHPIEMCTKPGNPSKNPSLRK